MKNLSFPAYRRLTECNFTSHNLVSLEGARMDTKSLSLGEAGNGNGMGQAETGRHAMWQNITCGERDAQAASGVRAAI